MSFQALLAAAALARLEMEVEDCLKIAADMRKAALAPCPSPPRPAISIPQTKNKGRSHNSEAERIEILRAEPLAGEIMPDRVWCKECKSWVGLDKRRRYYVGTWKKHVMLYHLPGGAKYEKIQKHLRETGEKLNLFVSKRKDRRV